MSSCWTTASKNARGELNASLGTPFVASFSRWMLSMFAFVGPPPWLPTP